MTKKMLFIFNPHSGKGQIKNHLLDILDKFAKAEYDITVRPTQERLDAYNYIKNNGDKFDRIVVSGGDGTLNEAVKDLWNLTPTKGIVLDISQQAQQMTLPLLLNCRKV